MAHISALAQPTSSLRPGTLPRRRRPTPATPTPAIKAKPARTASSSEEAAPAIAMTPALPHPSQSQSSPRPASSSLHDAPDTPKSGPAQVPTAPTPTHPGPSKTPGTVGVRFHGHHPSSSSSSSKEGSSSKGSRRRTGTPQQPPNRRLDLLKSSFDARGDAAGGGHVRLGQRNTVSNGVGAGAGAKEKRSRSLANPRSRTGSRARSVQRVDSTCEESTGKDKVADGDDAPSRARAAARERRREERGRRRVERAKRRKARKAMEEGMCVQRVGGRGRVEVAFFADDDDGHVGEGETEGSYVLLQVVDPESDSEDDEDDDEDGWGEDVDLDGEGGMDVTATPGPPTLSTSEPPSSPVLAPTAPIPSSQTAAELTKESPKPGSKELRLYLPSDLSTHIDGVPALNVAQVREGCEFIEHILSSPGDSTTSSSTAPPSRVRVIAPRARPEDAWAVALCYQAGVESSVTTAATASVKTTTTMNTTTSAGAARLIATTNTSTNARTSESSSRDAVRRLSVPVPVPPLALVRGEDGEVEGVVEVAVDVETLDEGEESATADVNVVAIVDTNEIAPSQTLLPITSSSSANLNTDADPGPDADPTEEDTFMLHPAYTYSAVHCLAMRLLDEGVGEWHTRGKQWEERVERMQYAVGATTAAVRVDLEKQNVDARRRFRHELHRHENGEEANESTDFSDEGQDDDGAEGGDSESEEDEDEYEEGDEEEGEDAISAGARQGSESTGECEVDGHLGADDAVLPNDNGEYARGRTHEPHTRMGHGVPLPSKYEEPSSAFVSSAHGRSKSRARSKSKVEKCRARSMSVSASASKATGRGRRKSRLSMSYDNEKEDDEEGVVADRATRKIHRAELRRLRLVQRRARKEEEKVEAYAGVRMEWRGVLSFDGVQKLVGVWTPTSAAL
ncbi:hypothetical protein D9619_002233 [Psilocybe cf. subviscida]|uniref:Uncharacterized protein n=1 Tax=Psilocybe cf. subviscida TaxID=2480587 RepID=A0A8H5BCH8_9AGAR|nr:hypothetical protein D9619_002233 [Psilocybe cf. subviscida]